MVLQQLYERRVTPEQVKQLHYKMEIEVGLGFSYISHASSLENIYFVCPCQERVEMGGALRRSLLLQHKRSPKPD